MKFNIYIYALLLVFFSSCKDKAYKPEGLTKLSDTELIERAKQKISLDPNTFVFKNENGEIIGPDSIKNIQNPDDWATDTYVDNASEVKELVLRKSTPQDLVLREQIILAFKYQPPLTLVDIDCALKQEILQQVFESDQGMRTNSEAIPHPEIDQQNLITVISLIEKCGMPTLEEVSDTQMSAIWLVFQHGDNANRKKYLPILEQSAKNGDLNAMQIAMMKDRTMMMDGEPQIYGTQVTKNGSDWILYELANPETVNKRRAVIGFEPLQDYLKRWNIEFNVKQVE